MLAIATSESVLSAHEAARPEPESFDAHALVVGVSAYQRVRPLPAVQDAQDVAALLADPRRCGYPQENVRVLLEEQATRAAILDALDELAVRTRPSSTVFIYFSGHGGGATYGGEHRCYLMPVDGEWSGPAELEVTAISGGELSRRLRALPAARVTVVLDCCRAAGLAEPKDVTAAPLDELTRDSLSPLATGRGRAVLAASRADGLAYVTPGQRNGVFTRHLLDGLRGGASLASGVVRICDLFHYVQERVAAEQPGQRPVFKAELEENFPIARAPAPPATTPVALPPAPDQFPYDVFLSYARKIRRPVRGSSGCWSRSSKSAGSRSASSTATSRSAVLGSARCSARSSTAATPSPS